MASLQVSFPRNTTNAAPVLEVGRDGEAMATFIEASAPFPFSAIVGQDDMKLAFLIAAIDPSVGGVLVFGDRGTGKSTAVRALAQLLPQMRVVAGCA